MGYISSLDLERVIKQYAKAGTDPARIARLREKFPKLADLEEYEARLERTPRGPSGKPIMIAGDRERYGTEEERATWRAVLAALKSIEDNTRQSQQPTVHHHNGRHTYPDANTMRRNTVNGESMRTAWEGN